VPTPNVTPRAHAFNLCSRRIVPFFFYPRSFSPSNQGTTSCWFSCSKNAFESVQKQCRRQDFVIQDTREAQEPPVTHKYFPYLEILPTGPMERLLTDVQRLFPGCSDLSIRTDPRPDQRIYLHIVSPTPPTVQQTAQDSMNQDLTVQAAPSIYDYFGWLIKFFSRRLRIKNSTDKQILAVLTGCEPQSTPLVTKVAISPTGAIELGFAHESRDVAELHYELAPTAEYEFQLNGHNLLEILKKR